MSPAAASPQIVYYGDFNRRLAGIDSDNLSPQDLADYDLLQDSAGLALVEYRSIQPRLHNPALYTETITRALHSPYESNYAPAGYVGWAKWPKAGAEYQEQGHSAAESQSRAESGRRLCRR